MATPPETDAVVSDEAQEVSVYDIFLAALPFPMIVGIVAGRFTPLPVHAALFIGATITVVIAGWGLFWHYPS